jgi:hypothetical protein
MQWAAYLGNNSGQRPSRTAHRRPPRHGKPVRRGEWGCDLSALTPATWAHAQKKQNCQPLAEGCASGLWDAAFGQGVEVEANLEAKSGPVCHAARFHATSSGAQQTTFVLSTTALRRFASPPRRLGVSICSPAIITICYGVMIQQSRGATHPEKRDLRFWDPRGTRRTDNRTVANGEMSRIQKIHRYHTKGRAQFLVYF